MLVSLLVLAALAGLAWIVFVFLGDAGSRHLASGDWERQWREDSQALRAWDDQLQGAVEELLGVVAEGSADPLVVPTPEERARARGAWVRVADIGIGVHRRAAYHRDFVLLRGEERRADRGRGFLFCDVADLVLQEAALRLTDGIADNPKWQRILNEPQPEFGLEEGSFDFLRDQIHNPERFARQYAARAYLALLERDSALRDAVATDEEAAWLLARAKALHARVGEAYAQRGTTYTSRQAKDLTAGMAFRLWFPVQKNVANAMGNVKVHRQDRFLIAPDQIRTVRTRLQPGDIGVTRKNWYLSNAGIPGFWPHAVLHLGTAEELAHFFEDEATRDWVRSQDPEADTLPELLARRHPQAWANYSKEFTVVEARARGIALGDIGEETVLRPSFIESIAPGVVFRLAEQTLAADFAAVLRPRVPKVELAIALERAFSHAGKPYDYNFDFTTDHQLVCSELVYKAYQPAPGITGLDLPLDAALGRPLLAPTRLIRLFDEQHDSDACLFDFVAFLDAREAEGRAFESTAEALRESWKRPKWDVLLE